MVYHMVSLMVSSDSSGAVEATEYVKAHGVTNDEAMTSPYNSVPHITTNSQHAQYQSPYLLYHSKGL